MHNAEVRWSTHPSHKAEWLEMAPREMAILDHTGLMMDMVATRDIEVGEEVYLNYGKHCNRKLELTKVTAVTLTLLSRRSRLGEEME